MKLHELMEAYHKIPDSITGLDRDFAEYALNEVPLSWGSNKIDQARRWFGGVSVGKVYRGIKINSAEELQEVNQLATGGGVVDMQLESASPDWSTAASFANYVKSYDELTMMRALSAAVKNGSAGSFGTAILTLEPTPEQVIVKTYSTGSETEQNPNWRAPKRSAESEVILYGNIRCIAAAIIPPLTKANWKETLLSTVKTVQQIEDWSLLDQWLAQNNISKDELNDVSQQIWANVIKTDKDLVDAINTSRLYPATYIQTQPKLMRWLTKHVIRDGNQFYVELDGNRIRITNNSQLVNKAWIQGSQTQDGKNVKNITIVEQKIIESLDAYIRGLSSPGPTWANAMYKIDTHYSISECVLFVQNHGRKLAHLRDIKQKMATIQANIADQLKFMSDYVSKVHENPAPIIGDMEGYKFANELRAELELSQVFPKLDNLRKQLIGALYHMVPHGRMDDDKQKLISWWTDNIRYFLV